MYIFQVPTIACHDGRLCTGDNTGYNMYCPQDSGENCNFPCSTDGCRVEYDPLDDCIEYTCTQVNILKLTKIPF